LGPFELIGQKQIAQSVLYKKNDLLALNKALLKNPVLTAKKLK
jgi:hypothetical protein